MVATPVAEPGNGEPGAELDRSRMPTLIDRWETVLFAVVGDLVDQVVSPNCDQPVHPAYVELVRLTGFRRSVVALNDQFLAHVVDRRGSRSQRGFRAATVQ